MFKNLFPFKILNIGSDNLLFNLLSSLKKELIRHFGGMKRLKDAEINDLKEVEGIGTKKAILIQKHLN